MLDELARYPRKTLLDPIARILSRRALRRFMRATDLDTIVDTPVIYRGNGFYGSIGYLQYRSELIGLARAVSEHKPKVIVEIGSYMGGTLYVFCRSNPDAELIVSMDLPGGVFGGGCTSYLTRFFSEFVYDRPHSRLETIRDDSHSVRAEKSLERLLDGRSIDFLYIDADHTYDGACSDFRTYSKFVSLGGLIAFHDIYSPDPTYGVPRLWKELTAHYPSTEFSASADSIMGIGLLTYTGPSSVCNPGA